MDANWSNVSSPSTPGDDVLVVSFWSTILIYALITNTLTVIGIMRSRSMRSAASYWLVISLSVCDLFMIFISFLHIIPATYLHEDFMDIQDTRAMWAMFAYNVFWYTGVVQLAAMAVNRFVSIVFPIHYKTVFAPKNTLLIIGSLFLLGLLSSIPTLHECCYIVYNHYMYVTYYVPEDSDYMWLDIFLNTISVLTMIVCYAAILLRVRKSTMNRRRHQMLALAAKARRTSAVPNTDFHANSPCRVKSDSSLQNGVIGKTPQTQQLFKQHLATLALSASSSLSALDGEKVRKEDPSGTGKSSKRPLFVRTSSATALPWRIRTETEKKKKDETGSRLLVPRIRSRRHTAQQGTQHGHGHSQHRHQNQQQASRREIRLFVQFFVVSLVFLSTWVTWQWLPRIPNASKWTYFATTTFFFINNAVNPTVYLIFNSGLRHQVKSLCCPGSARKGDTARAAAAAAAAMGGNQTIARYNSSSDESNQNIQMRNNRALRVQQSEEGCSYGDEVSEEFRSSNLALSTSRVCV